MTYRNKIKVISILGAAAVVIGAFGVHGLKPHLDAGALETYKTASFYHFSHLMPMLMIALSVRDSKYANWAFNAFLAGILFFSGSLYLLSVRVLIGGEVWNFLGPITPIGGLFFIIGWLMLLKVFPKG